MLDVNPYDGLEEKAFWRTGSAVAHPLNPTALYTKRFDISKNDRIATAGSCFAQHIARALRGVGLDVIDSEPAPQGLPDYEHQKFGYGLYSARFANIYTSRQLVQVLEEAFQNRSSPEPVWIKNGRFFDSMRPSVEPEGLCRPVDVEEHRAYHLSRVRHVITETNVFVFTLGLTECWEHRDTGWVFPTAPGTIAGSYDKSVHAFKNLAYPEVLADMERAIALISQHAKTDIRFLFTVSPVPLTATATDEHVQVATTYSKSVLRSVVGELVSKYRNVAYFPSFEMVTSPASHGAFYDQNMRTVNWGGVDIIMRSFLHCHNLKSDDPQDHKRKLAKNEPHENALSSDDIVCEEALLDAFAPT